MNKILSTIVLTYSILFSGSCSSSPTSSLPQNKKRAMIEALEKDDHQSFQGLLEKYKSITQYDRYDFLYISLSQGCFHQDIKAIMNKNSSPFEAKLEKTSLNKGFLDRVKSLNQSPDKGHEHRAFDIDSPGMIITSLAGQKLCYEALELIKDKVSAIDFAKAIYTEIPVPSKYPTNKKVKMIHVLQEHFENLDSESSQAIERLTQTSKIISMKINESCEKSVQESCIAKEKLQIMAKTIAKNEDTKEKERIHHNSPSGMLERACSINEAIKRQQSYIDFQKEVGKKSGVVNASILHKAGSQVVQLEYQLNNLGKDYKVKTGKNLNLKVCP